MARRQKSAAKDQREWGAALFLAFLSPGGAWTLRMVRSRESFARIDPPPVEDVWPQGLSRAVGIRLARMQM